MAKRLELPDLGSKTYRELPRSFNELTEILIASGESERQRLQGAVDRMLEIARVTPLDKDVFNFSCGIQVPFDGMSAQDAFVLASIVSHLAAKKLAQSCFLNRNTKDFDDPNVREMLDEFGCKFLVDLTMVSATSRHSFA